MVSISRHDVADIYNSAFAEPGRLKEIGGILVWVHDSPYRIVRFSDMKEMEFIWKIQFDFMWEWGDEFTGKYQSLLIDAPDDMKPWDDFYVKTGMIRFRQIRGDINQILRDFVILKLFDHEWVRVRV